VNTLTVLVTVKAYPAVSRRKGEVECVAGIDATEPRWILSGSHVISVR
jgi:hypothetical protein